MGRASPIQQSFNSGEWSSLMSARTDLAKYGNAVELMQNWIPAVQGPAIRRSGTPHVAAVKDSTAATRLAGFEFSTIQAYILEFGNQYLRFYRDRAQITSGGPPYEIATNYLTAEVFRLQMVQSADVMYIAHSSHKPRKLSRTGHTAWTITDIDFRDGPYLPTNNTATTLTPGASTGLNRSLTASAVTGINNDQGFLTTDVGRLVRIQNGANWGWAKIISWTSSTVVRIDIEEAVGTSARTNWRLGAWSDTTGYPSAVAFFEDRLFWGGGVDFPQFIAGSRTGDYENHRPTDLDGTVVDDHAVSYTLNSGQVNAIRWMLDDEKGLAVGTVGGEWMVRPSDTSEALTPTNIKATRSTARGSAEVQPVYAGDAILFAQRSARKVRELAYVFDRDGFKSPDMTTLADHITESGLTQMALQKEPQPILWCSRADGLLVALTYERDQDVIGWHRHVVGGFSDAAKTLAAKVESVAVIPTPDGTADELWMVVERYINGATVRYVEYMSPMFTDENVQADAFFVDSGLTYDGAATTAISGLGHLEGETVSILADGAVHPDLTVSSGAITLSTAASKVHVGLQYNSDLKPLRLEAGASDGTAQGKLKRIHRLITRVHRTLGLKVGADASSLDLPKRLGRQASDPMGTAPVLYSGDVEGTHDSTYDTEGQVYYRQDQPLPATILAIMAHVVTENRQ